MQIMRIDARERVKKVLEALPLIRKAIGDENVLHIALLTAKEERVFKIAEAVGLDILHNNRLHYAGKRYDNILVLPFVLPFAEWKKEIRGRTRLFTLVDAEVYDELVLTTPHSEPIYALSLGHLTVANITNTPSEELFIPVDVSAV